MGIYLNPGNESFQKITQHYIYVDKSGIIPELMKIAQYDNQFICVSRPRRFGKTVIGNMLSAFFSKGCDSRNLFNNHEVSKSPYFEKYLNSQNVIKIDLNGEFNSSEDSENLFSILIKRINKELLEAFPQCNLDENETLPYNISSIYNKTGEKFVIIIDEYDVLVREAVTGGVSDKLFDKYLKFLSSIFKNEQIQPAITLAYLTGILPIAKQKIQSKLNNFEENTMISPNVLAPYIGFTSQEVETLCNKNNVDYQECRRWYDGYKLNGFEMYNPKSVIQSILKKEFVSYWGQTSTYEVVADYIGMNFDGTKDRVIKMISGSKADVNISTYKNTMSDFRTCDDVFTYLIHLGYLAYEPENQKCYIPNKEVRDEWISAISVSQEYEQTDKIIKSSKALLYETINGNEKAVAASLDISHIHVTSNRSYNNEDSLQSAIYLSYIYALNKYTCIREMTTGKGFADVVYIPFVKDMPAMIIELKRNKTPETALNQIKEKQYFASLSAYSGNLLFVAINYNEQTKLHTCKIEKFTK